MSLDERALEITLTGLRYSADLGQRRVSSGSRSTGW
jgi:hypothetical protein